MFSLKRLFKYFKEASTLLGDISRTERICKFFLWIDSTWSLVRYGCLIRQYTYGCFYKIIPPLRRTIMTQRRLESVIKEFNDPKYIYLLKNKNVFNETFSFWVKRKWLWSRSMELSSFQKLIEHCKMVFIKPLDEQEGKGIKTMKSSDLMLSLESSFQNLIKENCLIEEPIRQHPLMAFNNSAVNTVRVITCLDSHGEPHILRAALRVGVGASMIDNYSAGGVMYDVDVETGHIDNQGIGHDRKRYIYHPGSNICMLGFKIPNWDKVVDGVCKAATLIPKIRFVGWDVAITEDGIELIEGNHNPGLYAMESAGRTGAYSEAMHLLS